MLPLSQTFCGDDFERAASNVATTHGYPRICRHSHCVRVGSHTSTSSHITPSAPYYTASAVRVEIVRGVLADSGSVVADLRSSHLEVLVESLLRLPFICSHPTASVRSQSITREWGTMIVGGGVLPALQELSPIGSLRCHVFIPVSERHKGRPSRSERQTESDAECASVGPLMQCCVSGHMVGGLSVMIVQRYTSTDSSCSRLERVLVVR